MGKRWLGGIWVGGVQWGSVRGVSGCCSSRCHAGRGTAAGAWQQPGDCGGALPFVREGSQAPEHL